MKRSRASAPPVRGSEELRPLRFGRPALPVQGNSVRERFGARLRALRLARGSQQAKLAEALGISHQAFSKIERGTMGVLIEHVPPLCRALGIAPNDLFDEHFAENGEPLLRQRFSMLHEHLPHLSSEDVHTLGRIARAMAICARKDVSA